MLGTSSSGSGGISSVVNTYQEAGLFERAQIKYVSTHQDGGQLLKAKQFLWSIGIVLHQISLGHVSVMHAHVSSGASFWRKSILLALARFFGVPTIFHLHCGRFADWAEKPGIGSGFRRWCIFRTLQSSDMVIVLGQHWKHWVSEFSPLAKVTVVGNPVIAPAVMQTDEERGSRQGAGRILYLGLIHESKGVYDLLKAWPLFRQRCPGWQLVIGGKGDHARLREEAERLGVTSDLDYLGWVSGVDRDQQLRRADILVLPSYREGMPITVLEGMANGAAVATTSVGDVPDMMQEGVHGLWMKPGDIESIAETLVRLAESPELRERLTRAAYAHVMAHHCGDVALAPLLSAYTQLAENAQK
jgi:glycosyltransferase involved in cell wall biosynthesis